MKMSGNNKGRNKKSRYAVLAWAVIMALTGGVVTGCSPKESAVPETQAEMMPSSEETTEQESANVEMITYDGGGITLEYPSSWELNQESGEDGTQTRFLNKDGEEVFWIELGEAWRVDLSRSEEDYHTLLSEQYQGVEIIELSATKVGGYDAQKLIVTFDENGKKQMMTKHILIVGYVFFDISYLDSQDAASEDNVGEDVIASVRFPA